LSNTAIWLTPESNQTSRISIPFSNSVELHFWQRAPGGSSSEAGRMYHASAPSFSYISATKSKTRSSFRSSLQVRQKKAVIGTPHTRCREIVQSGRDAIMLYMRSSPHRGSHRTRFVASNAFILSDSSETNHCSVARKRIG